MYSLARKAVVVALISTPLSAFAGPTSEAEVNAQWLSSENTASAIYIPDNTSMTYSVIDNNAIIEGDIVVGDNHEVANYGIRNLAVKHYDDVFGGHSDELIAESAWSGNTTWQNSTVPYVISSASQGDTNAIRAGMNLISSRTGVKFVQRSNQSDYIEVIKGSGCYSSVGRRGGRQELSIGNGCAHAGIVAHEFLHALGFWHEQSRYDRDNHVRINYGNISAGKEHNFNKHGSITTSLGGYDYRSIMHYGYKSFSKNGLPTIESLNSGVPSSQLGQRNNLTDMDAAAVSKIYGGPTTGGGGDLKLYQHCNYGGYSASIGEGNYTLSQLRALGVSNDDISSIAVPAGYEIDVFQHDNFGGSKVTLNSNNSCLVNVGFNDEISSVVVRKIVVATVFQHCDLNGYSAQLKVGRYTLSQLQQMGVANDDVSSLTVAAGYKATLYQHNNFTGSTVQITSNDTCLVNNGFNDEMSSIEISKN